MSKEEVRGTEREALVESSQVLKRLSYPGVPANLTFREDMDT